jgi:glucose-1-phosphate cytidylyltransferase
MVEVGGQPMLWHIMSTYAAYGFKEFVVALGYKGEIIKDYFVNYRQLAGSLTVNLKAGTVSMHEGEHEDWIVHLLDTGAETNTGGRVKRIAEYVGNETFMLTYGDGVSNVNIPALVDFHRRQKTLVTLTAVRPPARFGQMVIRDGHVTKFEEKAQIGEGWINGGFFVLEPGIRAYIAGDDSAWEYESLEQLATEGQVSAYQHEDFWQCMDTIRDVHLLNRLWEEGKAPWKVW